MIWIDPARVEPRRVGTFQRLAMPMAIFLVCTAGLNAATATYGTLSSQKGTRSVYDWELQALLGKHFDKNADGLVEDDILIYFTECYGGDKLENFNNTANETHKDAVRFSNASVYSAAEAGKTSQYGGYHDNAAAALKPGATSNGVHNAGIGGKAASETPQNSGPDKTVGGTNSTHVLVWSGQSNSQDESDIVNIINSFSGKPNTTVNVLANTSSGGSYLNNIPGVTIGDATAGNLDTTLAGIAAQMATGEQFILFVTDHGNHETVELPEPPKKVVTGGGSQNYQITIPVSVVDDWSNDPNNVPTLSLVLAADSLFTPSLLNVTVNNIDSFFDVFYEIDFSGYGPVNQANPYVQFSFDESVFGISPIVGGHYMVDVMVHNFGSGSLYIDEVILGSGDIAKVPEPASMAVFALLSAIVAGRRRPNHR